MRTPLLLANWKLNGDRSSLDAWLEQVFAQQGELNTDIVLLPSFVLLLAVEHWVRANNNRTNQFRFAWGGQNVSDQNTGAYSGEVSAPQLRDVGCQYALVGHSERRHCYGEDDAMVAARLKCALDAGLVPVLCVGETQQERASGKTETVLRTQLTTAIDRVPGIDGGQVVLAYEPVWAIGSGTPATVEQVQDIHFYLRDLWATSGATRAQDLRIVYGGSVRSENARQLVSCADVDGLLVGSASLDAREFMSIGACYD